MNLCMAATYDPDPRAPNGFRIPFNAETGEVILERWRNWRRHDPINLVAKYRANLKSLRGIYIDCGWRDQYHIHYGSRLLSQRLAEAGIKHRYEEFDDDHSDVDYRMDVIKRSRADKRIRADLPKRVHSLGMGTGTNSERQIHASKALVNNLLISMKVIYLYV